MRWPWVVSDQAPPARKTAAQPRPGAAPLYLVSQDRLVRIAGIVLVRIVRGRRAVFVRGHVGIGFHLRIAWGGIHLIPAHPASAASAQQRDRKSTRLNSSHRT